MTTNRETTSDATAAAEPLDGTTLPVAGTSSPTITYYQHVAAEFMAAFDKIALMIPKLVAAQAADAKLIRARHNVPLAFLGTVTASVEQSPELQDIKRLDPGAARATLQLLEAFRPVCDKVDAFAKILKNTLDLSQATLATQALQMYAMAKIMAGDPRYAEMESLVANMRRDLRLRGRPRTRRAPRQAAPAGAKARDAFASTAEVRTAVVPNTGILVASADEMSRSTGHEPEPDSVSGSGSGAAIVRRWPRVLDENPG